MAAGIETLKILRSDPSIYTRLENLGAKLEKGFQNIIDNENFLLTQNRSG